MLFNSFKYILFLPTLALLYYILPHRFRWVLLLAASYYFYMCWDAKYSLLMLLSTVSTFICSWVMERTKNKSRRKLYLTINIVVNLLILFVFKYFNFFNELVASALGTFNISYQYGALNVLLPVGISFYTFQALGYSIDVYRGTIKHRAHFGKYALFVSFFPQLVAGPIERTGNLLPQFDTEKKFNIEKAAYGFVMILWGLFKKMVIADRLAVVVNSVYNSPSEYAGMQYMVATVFFAFQIYCDFSGYSDIALGSAKILGFDLMQNFKRPYVSTSINEFWKRWHISLTGWFRDYVYIPLGGNRNYPVRNILVVFLVSGLWHGANTTFVLWGLVNGIYMVIGKLVSPYSQKMLDMFGINAQWFAYRVFRTGINFVLVCFSWIFFRANNVGELKIILGRLFILDFPSQVLNGGITGLGLDKSNLLLALLSVLLLLAVEYLQETSSVSKIFFKFPYAVRGVTYAAFIITILIFGIYGAGQAPQFIYFQF